MIAATDAEARFREVFADNLDALCQDDGRPLAAIARDAGCGVAALRSWRGGRTVPDAAGLWRLSRALGCPAAMFFMGTGCPRRRLAAAPPRGRKG